MPSRVGLHLSQYNQQDIELIYERKNFACPAFKKKKKKRNIKNRNNSVPHNLAILYKSIDGVVLC